MPPAPISMSSGCGPKTRRSIPMSRKGKGVVGRFELAEMMAQQQAAREVGAGEAVARIAEGKEMMREVPVRPDVRQSIRGSRVRHIPSVLGRESGNIGIERRQLVHQLAGPLYGEPIPLARRRRQRV